MPMASTTEANTKNSGASEPPRLKYGGGQLGLAAAVFRTSARRSCSRPSPASAADSPASSCAAGTATTPSASASTKSPGPDLDSGADDRDVAPSTTAPPR